MEENAGQVKTVFLRFPNKHGPSTACKKGMGGTWANNVYVIGRYLIMKLS